MYYCLVTLIDLVMYICSVFFFIVAVISIILGRALLVPRHFINVLHHQFLALQMTGCVSLYFIISSIMGGSSNGNFRTLSRTFFFHFC